MENSNYARVVLAASCAPLLSMASDVLGWFSDLFCYGDLTATECAVVPVTNSSSGSQKQLDFVEEIAVSF